jgi:hypothetical protein
MKTAASKRSSLAIQIFIATFTLMSAAVKGQQSTIIGSLQVFPENNPWNWDISNYEIHPNSVNYITSIGAGYIHPDFGTSNGIPYAVVGSNQDNIVINYTYYPDESDPGPFPIPLNAPIEGGSESTGDRHVIAVDTDNKLLYELYYAYPQTSSWDDAVLQELRIVSGSDFEAVKTVDENGDPIYPLTTSVHDLISNQKIQSSTYPNPFSVTAKIKFYVAKGGLVRIFVYNTLGDEITMLLQEEVTEGYHFVEFNGQNLPGGIYYYKISCGQQKETGKLVLLK